MKQLLLALVLLCAIDGVAIQLEVVPILYQGRCRPAGSAARLWMPESEHPLEEAWQAALLESSTDHSPWRCLPSRRRGEWLPLGARNTPRHHNPTSYPEPLFLALQDKAISIEEVADLLWEGYAPLIGTPYLESQGKQQRYPSYLQLKAELLLEQIPFTLILFTSYFAAALLLLLSLRWGLALYCTCLLLHSLLLAARIFILQRPPVSSMAETLIYVPWIVSLLSLCFRQQIVLICGALGAGGLLLLFWLSNLSEELESLQPVLDSGYWLGTHVLLVVGSYGVLLVGSMLAHAYLVTRAETLPKRILQTLYIGTGMLIGGTLLGGVWAAESWGRFWDWDPKESWAFISICTYLIILHARQFGLLSNFGLALTGAIAFFSITFTWYGVNYILGTGLHSYGFGEGGQTVYLIGLGGDALLLTALALRYRRNSLKQDQLAKSEQV